MNNIISVIVPVYKVEKYLDRCVQSIVTQSYNNLEIILVDDGSPDGCPAMCDEWAKKDKRIKVIHKENGGLSDARNAGLGIAQGDFIGFVDSDDWIAPDMYQRLMLAMNRDGSDVAACGVEVVWEDERSSSMLTKPVNCILNRNDAQKALLEETDLKQPVWYKMYRRETIANILFDVGKYHEDVFWSYQVVGNAEKVSVISDVGYYYWQRKDSIMGSSFSVKRLDAMEAFCKRQDYFEKEFPQLWSLGICRLWFQCLYYGQLALSFLPKDEQRQVFEKLHEIKRQYPLRYKDYSRLKVTQRIWVLLAKMSLRTTCKLRNLFGIGM